MLWLHFEINIWSSICLWISRVWFWDDFSAWNSYNVD